MTHNIALNYDTDLTFESRVETYPAVVSKIAYSVEKAAFVDIERTRFLGYVEVSTAKDGESVGTVDDQTPPDNTLTFSADERTPLTAHGPFSGTSTALPIPARRTTSI